MAMFKLKANADVDLINRDELHEVFAHHVGQVQHWFQEMARGFSTARFYADGVPSAGAISMPSPGQETVGPNEGFAWSVQRVSAFGLGTSDVLNIFRNDTSAVNYIGSLTANNPFIPNDKGFILRSGERLYFTGTGLTATGDLVVNGEALEVSELDLYKVL